MKRPGVPGRIAFMPSAPARAYFEELVRRLTRERGLGVRVTQREAFDALVELAKIGERRAILEPVKILDKPA